MSTNSDIRTETKWWAWAVGMVLATIVVVSVFKFVSTPAQILGKVTDADHIIASYEEYQSMYNSCQEVCTKISNTEAYADETAGGFTKGERVLALQNRLARLVEDYNAKSRVLTRSKWKNPNLPYQLSVETVCKIKNYSE